MKARRYFFALGVCVFCGLTAGSAQAEEKLTEDNIREFIEQTSAMASGQENLLAPDQVVAFLGEHIDANARFKSTMRYMMPGMDPQETEMSMGKDEFIAEVQKSSETMADYENKVEIIDIKISSDGRKATVRTKSDEKGAMPISTDGKDKASMPVDGVSVCNQIIMLSETDVIQMYGANCVTDIEFLTIQ